MDGTIDLNLLSLFVAVADASSFSVAARKLGLPNSSVSRGVARLEGALGAQLLHRTTRHLALSTAGAALYERVMPLLLSLHDSVGALPEREEQPSGELRITAPADLGATVLAEVCTRFASRYPSVRLDVWLTSRNVDLVAEGFDLALRASTGHLKDSSLVARKMSPLEMQLFGAPSYLARRDTPRTPEDATDHDWIGIRGWRYPRGLGPRPGAARVTCDEFFFVREAVRAGAGLGILPTFLCQADIATGQLVRVLPRIRQPAGSLVLLLPSARHVPRKVSAFRDFLIEFLAAHPLAPRLI